MIRRSDGPKAYWGYYQDYLEKISGKKIQKKIPSIFSKNHKAKWRKKTAETQVAADFQIWYKKLNVPVQYNMLMPIWPAPIA